MATELNSAPTPNRARTGPVADATRALRPRIEDYSALPPHPSRIEGGGRPRGGFCKQSTGGNPLVSIITVVCNGERHLEETMCSVLNQTYNNVEYIVVDGASRDGTLDILRRYDGQIDYWISEPDLGIYDAMNKGIGVARGDTIGLLNCGDTYEAWFVEKMVRMNSTNEDIPHSVIYCHFKEVLSELGLVQHHRSHMAHWRGMSICHQAMLIGKGIYSDLGLYDLSYKLAADYEYLLHMASSGARFIEVDAYGVSFRHGGHSSVNMDESHREARRINSAYFGALSARHLMFAVRSWCQLVSYYYLKSLLYRLLGTNTTNRIRLLKKSLFGTAKPTRSQ